MSDLLGALLDLSSYDWLLIVYWGGMSSVLYYFQRSRFELGWSLFVWVMAIFAGFWGWFRVVLMLGVWLGLLSCSIRLSVRARSRVEDFSSHVHWLIVPVGVTTAMAGAVSFFLMLHSLYPAELVGVGGRVSGGDVRDLAWLGMQSFTGLSFGDVVPTTGVWRLACYCVWLQGALYMSFIIAHMADVFWRSKKS